MSIQQIHQYHANVERVIRYSGSRNESALRKCFHDLLQAYATSKSLLLVPEVEVRTRAGRRVVPDATLKDPLRQDWGYWESKDEKDDLDAEIAAKLAKGYPSRNILFEDTRAGVLYQDGVEVLRADFSDATALDALLTRFISFEPVEVTEFHQAIQQFNADVPALAAELRAIIEEQYAANAGFRKALGEFLELCKKAINPSVEMADLREMIIRHVLTEDVVMTVFYPRAVQHLPLRRLQGAGDRPPAPGVHGQRRDDGRHRPDAGVRSARRRLISPLADGGAILDCAHQSPTTSPTAGAP